MKPARDPAYLAWLRKQPCLVCGRRRGVEAHHLDPNMGRRGPDHRTVPLCPEHHRDGAQAIHRIGKRRFLEGFGQLADALDQAVLVLRERYREQPQEAA